MSAPNFDHRQNGFPLYVHEDIYSKICPECGAWNMDTADVCEECGENLDNAELRYDDVETDFLCDEVRESMAEINKELDFFEVGLESGYYTGVQFTVNFKMRWGCELDPEELDNEDAHYYFDCCRSEMLRRYKRERRKLGKKLAGLAKEHGFEEIVCVGIFSNGEAIYRKVEPPKELPKKQKYAYKAKVAAKAVINA